VWCPEPSIYREAIEAVSAIDTINKIVHLPSISYKPMVQDSRFREEHDPGSDARQRCQTAVSGGTEVPFHYSTAGTPLASHLSSRKGGNSTPALALVLPREQHAYLKVLKAVDSKSKREALQQLHVEHHHDHHHEERREAAGASRVVAFDSDDGDEGMEAGRWEMMMMGGAWEVWRIYEI
jgi:hypothetical protein